MQAPSTRVCVCHQHGDSGQHPLVAPMPPYLVHGPLSRSAHTAACRRAGTIHAGVHHYARLAMAASLRRNAPPYLVHQLQAPRTLCIISRTIRIVRALGAQSQ